MNAVNVYDQSYDTANDNMYNDNVYGDYEYVQSFDNLRVYAAETGLSQDRWTVLLRTPYEGGRGAVKMKIDTQAQCNVLSKRSNDNMKTQANLRLCRAESTIRAFDNSVASPLGKTRLETIVKGHTYVLECEEVDGEVPNLLGTVDSERPGPVRRVHSAARQIGSENVNARESMQGVSERVPHCQKYC